MRTEKNVYPFILETFFGNWLTTIINITIYQIIKTIKHNKQDVIYCNIKSSHE